MGTALIAPGVPMLVAPNKPALLAGVANSGGGGSSYSGQTPSDISGLTGWWDAGLTTDILSPSGAAISGWNSTVGSLADKSGAGSRLAVYHQSGSSPAQVATPRLSVTAAAGILGGVGLSTINPYSMSGTSTPPSVNQPLPVLHSDQGLKTAPISIGSWQAWTIYLVWSRPNWASNSSGPNCLLSINESVVLEVDTQGGSGHLTLFPGASQTIINAGMTRRHTHAVILRNTPGSGVDLWVDQTKLFTGATNPMSSSLTANLLFLHSGAASGGAQCWFHEAATWGHALSSANISTLIECEGRWALGARKGINIFVTGQSNAFDGFTNWAWHLLAQGVAYYLGALSYGVIGNGSTMIGGQGMYPFQSGDVGYASNFQGSFLSGPDIGSSPVWSLGTPDGTSVQTFINGSAAEDLADVAAIMWPWSESDSCRSYSEKATFISACEAFLAWERGALSGSAASLPLLVWNALPFPYGNQQGIQMHREAMAALVGTSGLNVVMAMPQTSDAIPLGSSTGPVPGSWTFTQQIHRTYQDLQRFGMEFSPVVARAILASTGGDTVSSIPSGIPAMGGPKIVHAYLQNSTTVILTIQHDAGNDLIIPDLAQQGDGFTVFDGYTVASPPPTQSDGTIGNPAIVCSRVDATHLQLTLQNPLVNSAGNCLLFYPYGSNSNSPDASGTSTGYAPNAIGTGNAVTDNFSTITPPAGWNIISDLQWQWQSGFNSSPASMPNNYPLQATTTPIALSSVPD